MATTDTAATQQPQDAPVHCGPCGAPLAVDQRYCLNCGARGPAPVPSLEDLGGEPPSLAGSPPAAAGASDPGLTGGQAAFGAAVIVLVLGIGVVIGKAAGDEPQPQTAKAPVVNVGGGATSRNASASEFKSDWPRGKEGYTVQLQTLSKNGTDPAAVAKAKSEADGKGAKDIGALDSDDHSGLKGGNYVVYSGVFDKKAEADKALEGLEGEFSSAKVIKVSRGGGGGGGDPDALSGKKKETTVGRDKLEELDNLSPEEYSKRSRKLPETTKLPGKAPPKDNKRPGAGSDEEVIE